jgi:intermembrane space import and assembly protein 40
VASISEERKAQARSQSSTQPHSATTREVADGETTAPGSPEALEEEASEQGAFNEETGEINWDCPCLGGMAYGPCGEQFRAAFSCFVFSQEEPKGVDCIEHFKTMQNCFREHPEIYGAELEDDEDGAAEAVEGESAQVPREPVSSPNPASTEGQLVPKEEVSQPPATSVQAPQTTMASKPDAPDRQKPTSNMDDYKPMPKAWHDSRDSTPAN